MGSSPHRPGQPLPQTPQVFEASLCRRGHGATLRRKEYTDDCQLVEPYWRVYLAGGDYANIKLTTPEDQIVAEALWNTLGVTL